MSEQTTACEDNKRRERPLSNWAQIISAILGMVALGGIFYQVQAARLNAQQASARQVYMSYSEASLKYPELAEPEYEALKSDRKKFAQYKTYVAHMLFAYDEIFLLGEQPEWIAAFKYDLPYHKAYLCEENNPMFYSQYYPRMRELLGEFKSENCEIPAKQSVG